MLQLHELQKALLVHQTTSAGPIPPLFDPDGVYPYPSFVETSRRPSLKSCRFIVLENDFLHVTICPDLGGKVHSILDKRSGNEVLFVPTSIQPVRILPRLGFVPGGIEVSFPISHTPVQLERIACESRQVGGRLYAWCGERELHFGMQWTVEYSLGEGDAFLTQRTVFHNPSGRAHPWMSWSNAAVPVRPDTEFDFPNGPVLSHGAKLERIDWASQGPKRLRDLGRMTGFFWLEPDCGAFGAFTPSLGQGLYHVADLNLVPGIKLWSYGLGPHETWGRAASLSGETYAEIQGGPIRDQSIKELLQPGQTRAHVEFWIPSAEPRNLASLALPAPDLLPASNVPLFGWPPRPEVEFWTSVLEAFDKRASAEIPVSPLCDELLWAPSAMESLGDALAWAAAKTNSPARDSWLFQRGAWLAGAGRVEEALITLGESSDARARALEARLHLRARNDPAAAVEAFRRISDTSLARHPQVVVERDTALAALGHSTISERESWLAQVEHCEDEWLIERRAAFLLDQGKPADARTLLERTRFQLVHQRYARTRLWQRIKAALNLVEPDPPNWLGEDDLAEFGAYRECEDSSSK
ncbi:MAG: DUF5107 domain-containing protein [Verrucomicrobiia bacterium]